ncbi:MAG TPA: hypothetical protein VM639_03490 [Dongiaceae bacterium]|nr:hypothetical protein [Dongiaceae bacterium]
MQRNDENRGRELASSAPAADCSTISIKPANHKRCTVGVPGK